MTAKSATQRKQEQRERDAMAKEERLARLLAKTIKLDLYKSTDMALIRCMARTGIDEPQDLITRLIHNADLMNDIGLARLTELPRKV